MASHQKSLNSKIILVFKKTLLNNFLSHNNKFFLYLLFNIFSHKQVNNFRK